MKSKFEELFDLYGCQLSDEAVRQETARILSEHFAENDNPAVYKQCLSQIDLTSLNGSDTAAHIEAMTRRVNEFKQHFPHLPNVAALCVYPALVPVVKDTLTEPASISPWFPETVTLVTLSSSRVNFRTPVAFFMEMVFEAE